MSLRQSAHADDVCGLFAFARADGDAGTSGSTIGSTTACDGLVLAVVRRLVFLAAAGIG